MSAISLKSITGITSITTPAGVDNQLTLHTNDTTQRVKVTQSGIEVVGVATFQDIDVDGHTNLDNVSIAGVTTTTETIRIQGNNKYLQVGASNQIGVVHTGGEAFITNSTGHLTHRCDVHKWENNAGSSEYFRIDSDGKLLIGITASTSSDANLQVFKPSGNNSTIVVGNVATSASGLSRVDFCPSNSTVGARIECHATEDFSSVANRTADLVFVTRKDGINSEKLRIKADGKIGQYTSTPFYDFHSYKSSGTTRARLQTNGTSGSDYADMVVQAGGGNYIQQFIYGSGYGYLNGAASVSMTYGNIANAPVYFSTNNTSRALFDTSGNLNILDGNLIVASGHGISFSATSDGGNSSTSSSELLDDYEEGSWTPVIKGSSSPGTATYVSRSARYVKVGRLVHVYADVRWSAHNGSGGLEVHGLPYAQIGGYWGHFGVNYNSGMSYATDVHYGWANIGGDYIRYWETNSSGGSGTLALDSVVGEVHFYGHYLTTA